MGELAILESSARSECLKLQQQIASISAAQEVLHSHLSNSRARELGYEMRLNVLENANVVPSIPNGHNNSCCSSSSGSGSDGRIINSSTLLEPLHHDTNSGNNTKVELIDNINSSSNCEESTNGHQSPTQSDPLGDVSLNPVNERDTLSHTPSDICLPSIHQVQERAKETQIELDEARASLNDLILEIESVSVEEARSREQSARILRQMADRYGIV